VHTPTQTLHNFLDTYEEFPLIHHLKSKWMPQLTFRACTWPSPTRSTRPSYACQSPGTQAEHTTDPVGLQTRRRTADRRAPGWASG